MSDQKEYMEISRKFRLHTGNLLSMDSLELMLFIHDKNNQPFLSQIFACAIQSNHIILIEALINHGFDVNLPIPPHACNIENMSPLSFALKVGTFTTIETLLEQNPIHYKNHLGMLPIHYAIKHPHIFEKFIQDNQDVYAQDDVGNTPFHHAALHYEIECVKIFKKYNISPHILNTMDQSPYDIIDLDIIDDYTQFLKARYCKDMIKIHSDFYIK